MKDIKYQRIIQAAIETPWAILPTKLALIQNLITFRASGGHLTEDEIRARIGDPEPQEPIIKVHYSARNGSTRNGSRHQTAAVLPLVGTIIPRMDMFAESSGAVSIQRFQNMFRQSLADDEIDNIIIDIDSPGGQVSGVQEMADEIFDSRGQKPITAVANTLAASAAYWIATAADEIVVTPSSEVGSIGVFAIHEDLSKMLDQVGVKMSLISAGKYKTEGNPFEPLGDEAREAIQQRVLEYFDAFTAGVARNRGVSQFRVNDGFGQGRVLGAEEAVKEGMADRVATLDETISYVLSQPNEINANGSSKLYSFQELKQEFFGGDSVSIVPSGDNDKVIIGADTGGDLMPNTKDQPTKSEEVQALELPDGTKLTAEQVQILLAENKEARQEAKAIKVEAMIDKARQRGVAPATLQVIEAMLTKAEPDAPPVLSLGDEQYNMFGGLGYLLEVIPGRQMAELTRDEPGEKPPMETMKANPGPQTLEEAEEQAKKRRAELGIKPVTQAELA